MSAKVIPFWIKVNADLYRSPLFLPAHTVPMPEQQQIADVIAALARNAGFDESVFKLDGSINHNQLARRLQVNQSAVTRLLHGQIPAKRVTITRIAAGFGLSANDFLAQVDPSATAKPTVSLPPEAHELWELWTRLPRPLRSFFTEQMKSALEFSVGNPELSAALFKQAMAAGNQARLVRQRRSRA